MDVQPWQVLAGLTALLAIYGVSVAVLDLPVSIVSFVLMVIFVGIGVVLGRLLSEQFS